MQTTTLWGTTTQWITRLVVAVAVAFLTACTSAPVSRPLPQSQHVSGVISDAELSAWFTPIKSLVEQQLNVDLSQVDAQVVGTETIKLHAKDSLMRALSTDIDNHEFAEALVANTLASQSTSVLAIYAPSQQTILLHNDNLGDYLNSVQHNTGKREALQALLLHELIHATDDVKHNVFDQRGVSYQEVFSKSTILEGHAQWQARRLCAIASCSNAFANLNKYMFNVNTVDDPALKYIQNRSFKNLEFVYREGERFIHHIMQRPNARQLLQLAFNQPPRDSLQIIDPSSFPNRSREARNRKISNAIKSSDKPWRDNERGLLTRNILAAAAFTANPETRDPIIEFYTARVVAAAKHEYYDKASAIPIPVAITVMQTDNDTTAKETSSLIFKSTTGTYQNLNGELVKLNHWQSDNHQAVVIDNQLGRVELLLHTVNGRINNRMINSEYPFEVVTASSGNFIVHIDGRYEGRNELMQYAGRLLIELRRREFQ